MPCILKLRIFEARNLPVMDKRSDSTDAYIEIIFGEIEEQTKVARKALNPVWNEDFRFEVADNDSVQNEPLELRVMDFDQVSRNDPVGSVFIDLNPLTTDEVTQINGWFPIFDTLRGFQGELRINVRLEFLGDINPFHNSSAGVQLFSRTSVPVGYRARLLSFVEELLTEKDPENHWGNNFRSARISNQARLLALHGLSGRARNKIGRKVLEAGGNAILGFRLTFDIQQGLVVRAMGTMCKLEREELYERREGGGKRNGKEVGEQ